MKGPICKNRAVDKLTYESMWRVEFWAEYTNHQNRHLQISSFSEKIYVRQKIPH